VCVFETAFDGDERPFIWLHGVYVGDAEANPWEAKAIQFQLIDLVHCIWEGGKINFNWFIPAHP
jgi:hypothetical protein